jgi:hypothetical protein
MLVTSVLMDLLKLGHHTQITSVVKVKNACKVHLTESIAQLEPTSLILYKELAISVPLVTGVMDQLVLLDQF